MSKKELAIVIRVDDRATPVNGQISASFLKLGDRMVGVFNQADKAGSGLLTKLGNIRTVVTGLAVFIGGRAVVRGFDESARALEAIGDAGERLGMSVEMLSTLRYQAQLNNVEFDTLTGYFEKARAAIGQFVVTGQGRAAPFLNRLGVQLTKANGEMRDLGDVIPELALAIDRLPAGERGIFAERIFGDQRALNVGLGNFRAFRAEAERLGAVFSPAQVQAAQQYSDAVDRVRAAWGGLKALGVEKLGPMLAKGLNEAAAVIASTPELVENVWKGITGDAEAEARFRELADRIGKFVLVSTTNLWLVAGEASVIGIRRVALAVFEVAMTEIRKAFPAIDTLILRSIGGTLSAVAEKIGGSFALGAFEPMAEKLRGLALGFRTTADSVELAAKVMRDYGFNFAESYALSAEEAERLNAAIRRLVGDSAAAGSEMLKAGDRAFRFSEILAKHRIDVDATRNAYIKLRDEAAAAFGRSQFVTGLLAGFEELDEETKNFEKSGRAAAAGIGDALSTNLAGALKATTQDINNFGEAWKTAGAKAIEAIGDIALKMAATRVIGSFLGIIASSAAANPLAGAGGGGVGVTGGTTFYNPPVPGYGINTGGFITRGGVHRFAAGGYVPGPAINRDMVPAVLTPGEYVLNRAATARAGVGNLHRFNRGGEVPGGMGGGYATGPITINVYAGNGQGGGVDARAIGEAAKNGVLAALQRDLTYRGSVRALVGGAS